MNTGFPHTLLLLVTLLTTSCSQGQEEPSRGHYPANTQQKADAEFIRFTDKGQKEGLLETAIVTYEGKQGEVVELIAAVHIADQSYYQQLAKLFKGYDSLLYELIKPKGSLPPKSGERRDRNSGDSLVSTFQRLLRDQLALEFQLDAIDYRASNFVHADLDAETFQQLSDERGESLLQIMLKTAMAEHAKSSKGESKTDPLLGWKLIAAFFSKDSSRALKYLLAQQLQHMEELMAGLGKGKDGEGSVILIERNKKLMQVLRQRLHKGEKRIGVFFGGAHLSDVEERIFAEIGLRRTKTRWLKAWVIEGKKQQ